MEWIFLVSAEFSSQEACRTHFIEEWDKIGVACRALLDLEPVELRMQKMQEQDFSTQWNDHAVFKPFLSDLVQDHIFAYGHQKGLSFQRDTASVGPKTLRACLGDVHKLCKAIGMRDDRYTWKGMIEMDEGYFTIEASKKMSIEHKNQDGEQDKI